MLHKITVVTSSSYILIMIIMLTVMMTLVSCKVIEKPSSLEMHHNLVQSNSEDVANKRQLLFLNGVGKETSTPDFIRLVVMRFVYGLASSMGVEERLESLFNGAFVPPNADGDLFGGLFGGGGGGGDSDDGDFADVAGLEGIFDDGAF